MWMLHQACSCEGDICCRMDCGVKLWRTQVCILWKEEPQAKLSRHKKLVSSHFLLKTCLQLERKQTNTRGLFGLNILKQVYPTNKQGMLKYPPEKKNENLLTASPLASAFAGCLFPLLNAWEVTSFGSALENIIVFGWCFVVFFSFRLRKTGKIHPVVFV